MTDTPAASLPSSIAAEDSERYRRQRIRRQLATRGLLCVSAVILAIWILAPIYLITITAFSPRSVVYEYPKNIIPQEFSTETMSFFVNSTGVIDIVAEG